MDKFSKCVGCGYCCLQSPCAVSVSIYGITGLCPALHWRESRKRYLCSIFKVAVKQFSDEGCSSSLNSWRKEIKIRVEAEQKANEISKVSICSKGRLFELLVNEKKTLKKTAQILQCSEYHVKNAAEKLGITLLKRKQRIEQDKIARWEKQGLTRENLWKLYNTERKTLGEMAIILDCGKDLLQSAMNEFKLPRRHKMPEGKGVITSVYAPEKEIKWIETIALREHKSQSEIIREGLKLVIQKYARSA